MLRIEAYSVLDGLRVRLVATCTREHFGEECGAGGSVAVLVPSEEIERVGEGWAVLDAITGLLREWPDVVSYVYS